MAIVAAPFEPLVYIDEPPVDGPSWWSRADPPGTWFTLATGFPWYLAGAVAVAALFWLLPVLLRRAANGLSHTSHPRPAAQIDVGRRALGPGKRRVASVAVCEWVTVPALR